MDISIYFRRWEPHRKGLLGLALVLLCLAQSAGGQAGSGTQSLDGWQEVVSNLPRWSFSHEVVALALSPDAKLVACALEPGQVLVWNVAEQRVVRRLEVGAIRVPLGKTARIQFAGGSRYLAVVHIDRYLVFDLVNHEQVINTSANALSLNGFFVGEDGVVAFSNTEGQLGEMPVSIFDLDERRETARFDVRPLEMGWPFAVTLSPDHRRVVTWHVFVAPSEDSREASDLRGGLAIWQTESGSLLKKFEIPALTDPRGMGFDEKGRIWGVAGGVRFLWDPETGRELDRFEVPEDGHILSDGRHFIAREGGLLRVDAERKDSPTAETGRSSHVRLTAVALTAPKAAILGNAPEGGHLIEMWHSETGGRVGEVGWPVVPSRSVSISPDGRHVASGSIDGIVRLWNAEQGHLDRERSVGRTIGALVFWDPQRLAVVTEDHVLVWDLSTGDVRSLRTLDPALEDVQRRHRPLGQFSTFSTERLGLSADGRLAYARGNNVYLWAEDESSLEVPGAGLDASVDRRSQGERPRVWHVGDVSVSHGEREIVLRSAELSADGHWLAVAHSQRSVILRDLVDGRDRYQIILDEKDAFRRVRLHPNRRLVVLDSQLPSMNLKVFDLERGETTFEVPPLDRFGNIGTFELSKDGRFLWVGEARTGVLRQYDMETGVKLAQTLPKPMFGPSLSVEALMPSSDGALLAAAYDDGSIRLWRTQGHELLLKYLWLGGRDGNWLSCSSEGDCKRRDDGTFAQRLSPEGRFSAIGMTKLAKEETATEPPTGDMPAIAQPRDDQPETDQHRSWELWILGLVLVMLAAVRLFIRHS